MLNKIKAMHTIEYLRDEISAAERYEETDRSSKLYNALKLVLEFVEDCNEDYLEDIDADVKRKKGIKMKYAALYEYLKNNELDDLAEAAANDEKNDQLILMISDHFDDEMMLRDSSTALLKDMFEYYSNHR